MNPVYALYAGAASVSLLLDPDGHRPAILTEIAVWPEHQGKGWGSEILRMVTTEADQDGVAIMLSVEPGPNGLTFKQLVSWYRRYGFESLSSDGTTDPETMCRLPQVST
ncbi:GNAT family N-acetyltransferase [Streptomyces sp. CBMA29]|uniref:GNAT family N-acetyltransferase n=1 Tax=Streptomyces sp. CBMA29 TaxID=1896314 RepID=UPI001661DC0A